MLPFLRLLGDKRSAEGGLPGVRARGQHTLFCNVPMSPEQ
jgi:hypothetical protein